MRDNPLCPTYDWDVQAHPNEEFSHCPHRDARVVTPPPFTVFEYVERHPTYFDVGRFHRVQNDVNEWQVLECLC